MSSKKVAAASGPKPQKPEDVIYATDYILPTAIAAAHAYWLYTKWEAMQGGDVNTARAEGGPLALPWWEPVAMVVGYLIGVLALWLYMEAIEPVRCRAAMIVHNVYLTLLSLFMAVVIAQETLTVAIPWDTPSLIFTPATLAKVFGLALDTSTKGNKLAWILWVNYNSKYVEFLDTAFMLLRKSYKQVTFLHVQHHAVMGPIMWLIITQSPGGASYFGPILNSVVHTVMYAYYTTLACKMRWPLPKQLITMMQMAQFVIIAWHGIWNLQNPGYWPTLLTKVELALMVDMLVLFGNFFFQSYLSGAKKQAKAEPSATKMD